LITAGVLSSVVEILKTSTTLDLSKNCAAAICSLVSQKDLKGILVQTTKEQNMNQNFVLKNGGLVPILNLLHISNPSFVKAIACSTVGSLVSGNEKNSKLRSKDSWCY